MNYVAHYERLVARARCRTLEGYRERHHVLPRCMGGDDAPENLVYLTPEEHYVAHQLLVRMYPSNVKLAHAAVRMAKQCSGNKAFGWLRRRRAGGLRGVPMSPFSLEHRAKLSASLRGKKYPMRRKSGPPSPETRAKIAAGNRGKKRPQTPEHIAKVAAANRGRKHSPEARANMSAARRGRYFSPETRAKIGAATRGKKLGPLSPEHRANIGIGLRGNSNGRGNRGRLGFKHSAETRAKISAARRAQEDISLPELDRPR